MPRRDAAVTHRCRVLVAPFVVIAAIGIASCSAVTDSSRTVDPNSCAGLVIDRSAPVIGTGDVVVNAPVRDVWAAHTDVGSYARWKSGYSSAGRLDPGPFRAGSQFRSVNGGMDILSTVRSTVPERCTLWDGPSTGIAGVHLWTFTPVAGGTRVHTEESWSGPRVDQNPPAAEALLDDALARGCADLKKHVER